jgi:alpha-tubulin suppressor-like RCC1 family protein
VDAVFQRALGKSPTDRYPSARSFLDALETALATNHKSPLAPRPLLSRRTVLLAGLGSAAVLVAGGTALVRTIIEPSPQRSADPANGPPVHRIAAGTLHNLALLTDGTVKAWGLNDVGQLGDGTIETRPAAPVTVAGLTDVTHVDASDWHSMALLKDGTVRIWGDNHYGQLGDGTTTGRSSPTAVPGMSDIAAIAVGGFLGTDGRNDQASFAHTLALRADGTILAWGSNDDGQLGDGTVTGRLTPAPIPGLTGVADVAAGGTHSMALLTDGTVMTWGDNGLRGLSGRGAPDRTALTVPVPIPGLGDVTAISAGNFHSLALLADGTVLAWGWNGDGQLGDGTRDDRPTPVPVSRLTDAIAIAAGDRFSLVLRRSGQVTTWGANEHGQLGDDTFNNHHEPADVPTLTQVTAVSASTLHCLALLANGTVMAWGSNADRQLGDGTAEDQPAPVKVSGFSR